MDACHSNQLYLATWIEKIREDTAKRCLKAPVNVGATVQEERFFVLQE
jgi:hypothetical protein